MMTRIRTKSLWLPALIAMLVSLPFDHRAAAQSWEDMLQPHFTSESFAKIIEKVLADEAGHEAAMAAFDAWTSEFASDAAGARARADALTARQHERERRGIEFGLTKTDAGDSWQALNYDWWETRIRLEQSLEQGVNGAIGDEVCRLAWMQAVRDARRVRELAALKAWYRDRAFVDAIAIFDSLTLTTAEHERLDETVEQASERIDAMIKHWVVENIRLGRLMTSLQPVEGEEYTAEQGKRRDAATQEWQTKKNALGKSLGEFAPAIAALLDPPNRDAFLEAIDREAMPEAFWPCAAELAVQALRMTEDIAPDKRAAVEAIFAEYTGRRDAVRRQLIDAIRKVERGDDPLLREITALWSEESQKVNTREELRRLDQELRSRHPAVPLLHKRLELSLDALTRIRGMFSDAEIESMPLATRLTLSVQ